MAEYAEIGRGVSKKPSRAPLTPPQPPRTRTKTTPKLPSSSKQAPKARSKPASKEAPKTSALPPTAPTPAPKGHPSIDEKPSSASGAQRHAVQPKSVSKTTALQPTIDDLLEKGAPPAGNQKAATQRRHTTQPTAKKLQPPKSRSLGQQGHPSPRRFDPPALTTSGREPRLTISASSGVSIKRHLPTVPTSFGAIQTTVQASATLTARGGKEGKPDVSLSAPFARHGGSISVAAHDLKATNEHLYGIAANIPIKTLKTLLGDAIQKGGTSAPKRIPLASHYRERVSVTAERSKSIPLKHGELTVTFRGVPGKSNEVEAEAELSVNARVRLKNGRSVTLTTSVAITARLDFYPPSHPSPPRIPVTVPVAELAALAAALAYATAVAGQSGADVLEGGEYEGEPALP